jgi:hypothetical protein
MPHGTLVVLWLLGWSLLGLYRGTADGDEIGQIKHLTGDVEVLHDAQSRLVIVGDVVEQGDVVITGEDGSVGITLIDDARIALGPKSRLTLLVFDFNSVTKRGSATTRLQRGSGVFEPGASALTVTTPRSTIRASGTRFAVEVP